MSAPKRFYHWQEGDLVVDCFVQPRASQDKIIAEHHGCLKIQITAPPVDGKANIHLSKYLATVFKLSKSHVLVLKGEIGRDKRIKIVSPQNIPPQLKYCVTRDS